MQARQLVIIFLTLCQVVPVKAALVAASQKLPPPKKIIFLHFYSTEKANEKTEPGTFKWIESSIGKAIHDSIKDKYNYVKIPDNVWQAYMNKNKISPIQILDQRTIRKMGVDLGADGIVYGDFYTKSHTRGDVISVEGRILSVIDGDVIARKRQEEVMGPKMFNAVDVISDYLAKQIKRLFYPSNWGAVWRSAALPGWGQMYKRRPQWAYAWASLVGTAFITSSVFGISALVNRSNYENAGLDEDALQYYESFGRDRGRAIVAFTITGILYLLNIVDAFLFNGNYEDLARKRPAVNNMSFVGGSDYISFAWQLRL